MRDVGADNLVGLSLILPVEVQHREFLAKLHVAAVAAAQGASVIIGDQSEVAQRLAQLPCSVYLDKSIAKTKLQHFRRLRRYGHVPVALCEEGLVYRNPAAYQRERIAPESFALVERFYMWGRRQKNDVAAVLGDDPRLTLAGNPRFDLLRPTLRPVWQQQADDLRRRYGRFVIVNSSFSRANRMEGTPDVVDLLRSRGTLGGAEQVDFYRGWVSHLQALQNRFVEMLLVLGRALPNHAIIFRPHPSENHEPWTQVAKDGKNLRVIHEGSVIPWMLAADAVIHNSCTTGVEAWLLDRPVFAYVPLKNKMYDSELPNAVSEQFAHLSDLVDAVRDAVSSGRGALKDEERSQVASGFIEAMTGTFSTDRILGSLPQVDAVPASLHRPIGMARDLLKRTIRSMPTMGPPEAIQALKRQKFPGASIDAVRNALASIVALRPELQGVECVPADRIPNTFRVWRTQ